MARAKKDEPKVEDVKPEEVKVEEPQVEEPQAGASTDTKPHPSLPVPNEGDMPEFKGDAKQDYLDINNPAHGNKTYVELQKEAE